MTRRAVVFEPVVTCPDHGALIRVSPQWWICPICHVRQPATQVIAMRAVRRDLAA